MDIDDNPRHHARRDAPWTSHAAAARVKIAKQSEIVLKAYRGGRAITDHDAYRLAGLSIEKHGARPRCSGLRQSGYIAWTGDTGVSPSGSPAKLSQITEKGMEYLMFLDFEPTETTTKPRPNGHKRNASAGPRGCDACPLQETWPRLKHPRMPAHGKGDVLVLGEAPGQDEDTIGRPFVGVAGKLLRAASTRQQLERMTMTNAVRCRPPGNRNPAVLELHACSIHLEADIAAGNYKAILGLGGVPLSRFLTGATITQIHGLKFPVMIAGRVLWYYPTLHPSYVLRSGDRDSPAAPILENDLKRFWAEVDSWPAPEIEIPDPGAVICARTEDEARAACARLVHDQPLGFDIETNGLNPNARGAQLMTAAVSDDSTIVAWPISHREVPNRWGLKLALELTSQHRWVGHNAGFELAWLRHHGAGWEPACGFDDSMAAARLFQRRETCLSLGILTRIYTGTNIKELSTVSTTRIADEPLEDVLRYNGIDAWGCRRIFQILGPKVDQGQYQRILDTVAAVTEAQITGLDVDQQAALALREEWTGRANRAVLHARNLPEVKRYIKDKQTDFNIGSNEQVAEALVAYAGVDLPRGESGAYKTDDQTLTNNAPDNPLAAAVLEYRHATKMNSTYIEPMLAAPGVFTDGRLHPRYSTMLTRTFRLSSEDPNIQNFPKRKDHDLRRPIVPPKGCIWAAADYSQLEARVYAMASQDRALVKSTIERQDIHSYWLDHVLKRYPAYADRLIHKTNSENRKKWRDEIKTDLVFSSLFGSTGRNVSDRTGIPLDISQEILGDFWDMYSGAARWLKTKRVEYRETGMARNLYGVEIYRVMHGNEMINYPIQSTGAKLVLDSQCELFQLYMELKDPHLLPRINIHDDLCFALPDNDEAVEIYINEISKVLVRVRHKFQIVPLAVEWRIGRHWAELHPVVEHVGEHA